MLQRTTVGACFSTSQLSIQSSSQKLNSLTNIPKTSFLLNNPNFFSYPTMCLAYRKVFKECEHTNELPVRFCTNIDVLDDCPGHVEIAFEEKVAAPLVCAECYRHEDRLLWMKHQSKIDNIRETIKYLEESSANEIDGLRKYRYFLEIQTQRWELEEVEEAKKTEVKDFRDRHGVWGDG